MQDSGPSGVSIPLVPTKQESVYSRVSVNLHNSALIHSIYSWGSQNPDWSYTAEVFPQVNQKLIKKLNETPLLLIAGGMLDVTTGR